jgi:hypothetical protein
MPITSVITLKADHEEAHRIITKMAPLIKKHGATSVRFGFCHSGSRTATVSVVNVYPDWQAYGRAAQGMLDDKEFQGLLAEAMKAGEIVDRSLMVMQEL